MRKALGEMRKWADDLRFGVRLAVGGGRTPWGRLTLTVIGIGMGVAVLLLASSVQNMMDARNQRAYAREIPNAWAGYDVPSPGQATVLAVQLSTTFRGAPISGVALDEQRPGAPVPPGVQRLPRPGELLVSPALGRLLNGPDGDLLRPRLPGEVVGLVGEKGLTSPRELYYYTGIDGLSVEASQVKWVADRFGRDAVDDRPVDGELWFLVALGVTALLVPVVVFVASTTRLAEAARQRRLAALRLLGASRRQTRRIASGEAVVGAVLGVVAGWVLFLLGRLLAGQIAVAGFSVFTRDIRPTWWYALLVSLAVPVIAAGTAVAVLRGTVADPMRVVRRTPPARRRLGWRCVPLVLGAMGILAAGRLDTGAIAAIDVSTVFVVSVVLLLIGVPLLLPWIVERAVGRLRGGALPWRLAVWRLQLTSGSAARSVSTIAVVLTGAIGLQTVLATVEADRYDSSGHADPRVEITGSGSAPGRDAVAELGRALGSIPGVSDVEGVSVTYLEHGRSRRAMTVADCPTLVRITGAAQCRDGDAFYAEAVDPVARSDQPEPLRGGAEWRIIPSAYGSPGSDPTTAQGTTWRIPAVLRPLDTSQVRDRHFGYSSLLVTPRAAEGIPPWARQIRYSLDLGPAAGPDAIEHVRNAAAAAMGVSSVLQTYSADDDAILGVIRYGLLLGALVTFTLIGCGLFVSAAEQIQERRPPMAVLAAFGVRRTTMAWSALLQNWVVMLAAIVVSVLVGSLLGVLVVVALSVNALSFDFAGLLGLLGIAALSVLVVTALTLPALRRAMAPEGLRTE